MKRRDPDNIEAAAVDLLRACEAWVENGWCVQGPNPKPDCQCDWHMAKAAVAKAYERRTVKAREPKV